MVLLIHKPIEYFYLNYSLVRGIAFKNVQFVHNP